MDKEALQTHIATQWQDLQWEASGQFLQASVAPPQLKPLAIWLKEEPPLGFDFLFCLTCVDWLKHLTMVYHLRSTTHRYELVLKVNLDRAAPSVDTVADIWRTAEFHEREVYELFGVHFTGHPDLRKLILPDEWQGYPLRKDYEDPVNMIKL